MNNLDSFDKALKDSLENYEVDYDPSQWTRLESRLGKGFNYAWLAVASVLIIAGSVLVYNLVSVDTVSKDDVAIAVPQANSENNKETVVLSDKPETLTGKNVAPSSPVDEKKEELPVSDNNLHAQEFSSPDNQKNNTNNINNQENTTTTIVLPDPKLKTDQEPVANSGNTPGMLPAPILSIQESHICVGEEVGFSAANAPVGSHVVWEFSNGIILKGKSVKTKFEIPGNYTVRVKFIQKNTESEASEQALEVFALPEPSFTWEEKVEHGRPYIVFVNTSLNGISPVWTFEDGTTSSSQEVKRFYRFKGDYPVKLSLESVNGCKAVAQESVSVESEYRLFAPNSFSPNGDGQNDYFIPAALKITDKEFTMTIYDRSNKLVYSTRSADMPWDGRYMDNQLAPSGVYVWMVTIKGEQTYGGTVTLLER